MAPTPGRIVLYTLNADDVNQVNRRRADAAANGFGHMAKSGDQVHVGNTATEGDEVPMLIVRVWNPTAVNGQVFLDGNDVLWKTSVTQNETEESVIGKWRFPPRV